MSIVSVDSSEVVFNQRFKPRGLILSDATKVHGLTAAKLRSAPKFSPEHADAIMQLLKGCGGVVGHNIKFDIDRLREQF